MLHDRLIFVESDLLPEHSDGYYSFELAGMEVYSEEGDFVVQSRGTQAILLHRYS
jgi:ribosomal 30S subunit maturation factor RimM